MASSGAVTLYHIKDITPEYHKANIEDVEDIIADIDQALDKVTAKFGEE